MAFNVVPLGENEPPTPPSLHVPPVAEPPTLPPKPEEVPPLQIALKVPPTFTVGGVHAFKLIPVIEANLEFGVPLLVPNVLEQFEDVLDVGIVLFAIKDL